MNLPPENGTESWHKKDKRPGAWLLSEVKTMLRLPKVLPNSSIPYSSALSISLSALRLLHSSFFTSDEKDTGFPFH